MSENFLLINQLVNAALLIGLIYRLIRLRAERKFYRSERCILTNRISREEDLHSDNVDFLVKELCRISGKDLSFNYNGIGDRKLIDINEEVRIYKIDPTNDKVLDENGVGQVLRESSDGVRYTKCGPGDYIINLKDMGLDPDKTISVSVTSEDKQ